MKLGLFTFLLLISLLAHGIESETFTQQTLSDVVSVARAIKAVQPYLGETKLMEYGLGILRASKKFEIDASVLIAITQQETAFRPNLPEGRAGEHGICQIRKMWLKQPAFKREFKNPTIADLHRPAKSFLMAAWILKDLKSRVSNHKTLPWWSYYNAVRFENRFKYYVAVNRNFAKLRKFQLTLENEAQYAENVPSTPATPSARTPLVASPLGLPPVSKRRGHFWTPQVPVRDVARSSDPSASNHKLKNLPLYSDRQAKIDSREN